ncbi:hypothetical protein [Rhodococcus pyridinivorans]
MAVLFVMMKTVRVHYRRSESALAVAEDAELIQPAYNHAIVLVSHVNQPTMFALGYAELIRPDRITALSVASDDLEIRRLKAEWERHRINVPLTVLESPYREITRPVLDYLHRLRHRYPHDAVTIVIPEFVVQHWWQQLLHNQSALRLKTRLHFEPGVVVASVPYQLRPHDALARPPR